MQVLKYKNRETTTDDFKAAIMTDIVTAAAGFLSSSGSVAAPTAAGYSDVVSIRPFRFSHQYNVYPTESVYFLAYESGSTSYWGESHYVYYVFFSSEDFKVTCSKTGVGSLSSNQMGNYYVKTHFEKISQNLGLPRYYTNKSSLTQDEFVLSLISKASVSASSQYDLNISTVPYNYTNITTAYPSWVSSAVTSDAVQYLPIAVPIPGTIPGVTEPAVTEPTATTPDENGETQIVTPDILSGMFSGLKGWLESLLTSILEAIQAIGEKIDAFGESIKAWWTETIADVKAWIEVKIQSIADWWTTFWADTIAAIKALGAAVTEFFTVTFPVWITDVKDWALSLPKTIIDAIIAALTAVFVPAAGYWDAKVAALQARFPLFNSILTTGKGFSGFFSGLGSRPPVIYIDLGSSASWVLGGRTIFLDLTWYSNYKPTMDLIIAGFLWLLFAWRFFLRLPGLLRGEVGTIDRLDSYLDEKRKKNGG